MLFFVSLAYGSVWGEMSGSWAAKTLVEVRVKQLERGGKDLISEGETQGDL